MADSNAIGIRVSLKDADAVKKGLKSLGDEGQRALTRIEKSTTPASRGLQAVNAVSSDLKRGFEASAAGAGALGAGMIAMGPAGLLAAASVGALVLSLGALKRSTEESLASLDALDDAANTSDFGVERLQKLRFSAEQSGVTVRELEEGLRRMTRRVGLFAADGGGPAAAAFKQLGISVTDTQGRVRASGDIFDDVVDKLGNVESQARKSAIASAIFGDDAGPKLTLLLNQGADGIARLSDEAREMGLVLDASMVQRGAELNDELQEMYAIIDTQLTGAFVDLGPALVSIVGLFAEMAKGIGAVADIFRDIEKQSTSRLESRLEELTQSLAGGPPKVGALPIQKYMEEFRERERIMQILLQREQDANRRPAASGGGGLVDTAGDKEADQIAKVIEALQFQLQQFDRTEFGRQAYLQLQRAGIDGNHAEAGSIVALTLEVEKRRAAEEQAADALKAAEQEKNRIRQEGEATIRSVLDAEGQYTARLTELREQLGAAVIDQNQYTLAVEQAEQRRMRASTDASDGIKRALIDIRDASNDAATAWEQDIRGMRDVARQGFTDILSGARSMSDVLGNIFNNIQNRLLGRVFDKTIGVGIDALLGSFLTFHTGGVIGTGAGGASTAVSPLAFAGAPRAHEGRMLGLARDEVPIIAQQGEGIFTPRQMDNANRLLGSAMAKPPVNVSIAVHNSMGDRAQVRAAWQQGGDGDMQISLFVDQAEQRMIEKMSRGDGLAPAIEGRYGLNPAAGTYTR